jgi:2-keto-3-deoxy-L-fuconate dehydrogenase
MEFTEDRNVGRLDGKRVVMTAAGMGIGRAAAIAMANEGAKVFASDIDEDALASLQKENPDIEVFKLDVLSADDVIAAKQRVGDVDVVFNCAGFVFQGTILDTDEDEWERSFNINVRAQYRMIRAFLPGMLEQGGGSIINMSSVVSSIVGAVNRSVYGSTKAAVIGLTKSVAKDFLDKGIRCNAICPGTVLTPSLEERMHAQGDYEKAKQAFLSRHPAKRFSSPEDVATIVVYLASDESRLITGQAHIIDDGWTI